MLQNTPVYVMGKKSARRNINCGKCNIPVKINKKYVISPINSNIIYHADCWRQGKNLTK